MSDERKSRNILKELKEEERQTDWRMIRKMRIEISQKLKKSFIRIIQSV